MDIEIKVTGTKQALSLWTLAEATADGKTYKIDMVRFDEPSQYGIRCGRISKLWVVVDGKEPVINYDRGWDIRPKTEADKAVLKAILKKIQLKGNLSWKQKFKNSLTIRQKCKSPLTSNNLTGSSAN